MSAQVRGTFPECTSQLQVFQIPTADLFLILSGRVERGPRDFSLILWKFYNPRLSFHQSGPEGPGRVFWMRGFFKKGMDWQISGTSLLQYLEKQDDPKQDHDYNEDDNLREDCKKNTQDPYGDIRCYKQFFPIDKGPYSSI